MTSTQEDTDELARVGEALSEYVGLGALKDGSEFDVQFSEIERLLPSRLRQAPAVAYRVLVLSGEDHARIAGGGELRLRDRTFGSWTGDERATRMLLRGRVAAAADGKVVVVVAKPVPEGAVVADVEAVYRALGWNVDEMECWFRYASWERELILRQDAELLTIRPRDVVSVHAPGDLSVLAPLPGERAWDEGADALVEIDVLPDGQPHAADGTWLVQADDGSERAVSWNGRVGAWDVVPVPPDPAPRR